MDSVEPVEPGVGVVVGYVGHLGPFKSFLRREGIYETFADAAVRTAQLDRAAELAADREEE